MTTVPPAPSAGLAWVELRLPGDPAELPTGPNPVAENGSQAGAPGPERGFWADLIP